MFLLLRLFLVAAVTVSLSSVLSATYIYNKVATIQAQLPPGGGTPPGGSPGQQPGGDVGGEKLGRPPEGQRQNQFGDQPPGGTPGKQPGEGRRRGPPDEGKQPGVRGEREQGDEHRRFEEFQPGQPGKTGDFDKDFGQGERGGRKEFEFKEGAEGEEGTMRKGERGSRKGFELKRGEEGQPSMEGERMKGESGGRKGRQPQGEEMGQPGDEEGGERERRGGFQFQPSERSSRKEMGGERGGSRGGREERGGFEGREEEFGGEGEEGEEDERPQVDERMFRQIKKQVGQALKGITQAEKQLAQFAKRGCKPSTETSAAIAGAKEAIQGIANTSADDFDPESLQGTFEELGGLRETIEAEFENLRGCANLGPLKKNAQAFLAQAKKRGAVFARAAKTKEDLQPLVEEANALIASVEQKLSEAAALAADGDYDAAQEAYEAVLEAREDLADLEQKEEAVKNSRQALKTLERDLKNLQKQLKAAKRNKKVDVGNLGDGVDALASCASDLKGLITKKADVDEVLEHFDGCAELKGQILDGFDQILGEERELKGIQGLERRGDGLDLGGLKNFIQ